MAIQTCYAKLNNQYFLVQGETAESCLQFERTRFRSKRADACSNLSALSTVLCYVGGAATYCFTLTNWGSLLIPAGSCCPSLCLCTQSFSWKEELIEEAEICMKRIQEAHLAPLREDQLNPRVPIADFDKEIIEPFRCWSWLNRPPARQAPPPSPIQEEGAADPFLHQ